MLRIPKLLLSQNEIQNNQFLVSKLTRPAYFVFRPAQCFLEFFRVALLFICQGATGLKPALLLRLRLFFLHQQRTDITISPGLLLVNNKFKKILKKEKSQ